MVGRVRFEDFQVFGLGFLEGFSIMGHAPASKFRCHAEGRRHGQRVPQHPAGVSAAAVEGCIDLVARQFHKVQGVKFGGIAARPARIADMETPVFNESVGFVILSRLATPTGFLT